MRSLLLSVMIWAMATPALAAFVYPDCGVDYQKMVIADPSQLALKGMASAAVGDTVQMSIETSGTVRVHNTRTGEDALYPIVDDSTTN